MAYLVPGNEVEGRDEHEYDPELRAFYRLPTVVDEANEQLWSEFYAKLPEEWK